MDLPLAIADGDDSPQLVTQRYGFKRRQVAYYIQAAEMLGFVEKRNGRYTLSRIGKQYVALTQTQRKDLLVRRILSLPIMMLIIVELIMSPYHRLSREQVQQIAATRSAISGSTIGRRAQSIFAWLDWVGEETGLLVVEKDSLSLSVKLRQRRK